MTINDLIDVKEDLDITNKDAVDELKLRFKSYGEALDLTRISAAKASTLPARRRRLESTFNVDILVVNRLVSSKLSFKTLLKSSLCHPLQI